MIISLSPETQRLLEERMKKGAYLNADDAVREALERLDQDDADELESKPLDEQTLAAIDRSEAQIARGEFRDWEEVKAELRAKYLGKRSYLMDDVYRVKITAEAAADIESIFNYIRQDSPQNAAAVTRRILKAIDGLCLLPKRFKIVGYSRSIGSPVHAGVVRPFIIYYRVDEPRRAVFIMTIQHGARQQPRGFK